VATLEAAVSASSAVRRALGLLQAASADWRHKGPSDGSEPLHWPAAVAAAKAHLEHALSLLETHGEPPRIATPDDLLGMRWFNGLTRQERAVWLDRANSAAPVDAWRAYQAAQPDTRKEGATQIAE
jgi:hypothetical protein